MENIRSPVENVVVTTHTHTTTTINLKKCLVGKKIGHEILATTTTTTTTRKNFSLHHY